jgi:hypothetical protein
MPELSADNPARLKLALALEGVATSLAGDRLEFVLGDEVWAAARVNQSSPLKFIDREGTELISGAGVELGVRRAPVPEFAARKNARGVALGEIARVRGTYATVVLGGGCSLASAGRTCALCLGRELTESAGEVWPVTEVVEAVRAAFEEGDAESVHLVLGFFPGDDAGVRMLIPYLDAIHRHFDTSILVTMHPPAELRAIDLTYASGVDVVCYSPEAADEESMRRYFPGRASFIGYERYMAALKHASAVFPSGAIWSELFLDRGSPDAVKSTASQMAALGIVPLLGVSAPGASEVDLSSATDAVVHTYEAVTRAGISLNWLRDLATTVTPLDARHLVAGAPQLTRLHQLGRSRLGAMTARSLARMRRRLRVRRVRASFDSSQL